LVDLGHYAALESISNFMVAVQSGHWSRLPANEQRLWLDRLNGLFGIRALGDLEELSNSPELEECHTIVSAQLKAVEKMI